MNAPDVAATNVDDGVAGPVHVIQVQIKGFELPQLKIASIASSLA